MVFMIGFILGMFVRVSGIILSLGDVFYVVWSLDSTWIVFAGDVVTDNVYELYVVDVSGTMPFIL